MDRLIACMMYDIALGWVVDGMGWDGMGRMNKDGMAAQPYRVRLLETLVISGVRVGVDSGLYVCCAEG